MQGKGRVLPLLFYSQMAPTKGRGRAKTVKKERKATTKYSQEKQPRRPLETWQESNKNLEKKS